MEDPVPQGCAVKAGVEEPGPQVPPEQATQDDPLEPAPWPLRALGELSPCQPHPFLIEIVRTLN